MKTSKYPDYQYSQYNYMVNFIVLGGILDIRKVYYSTVCLYITVYSNERLLYVIVQVSKIYHFHHYWISNLHFSSFFGIFRILISHYFQNSLNTSFTTFSLISNNRHNFLENITFSFVFLLQQKQQQSGIPGTCLPVQRPTIDGIFLRLVTRPGSGGYSRYGRLRKGGTGKEHMLIKAIVILQYGSIS